MLGKDDLDYYYNNNKNYVHRFIVFYTMRCLWKLYKNKVPELYSALFADGKIERGKTAFEQMLRPDEKIEDQVAERLEDIVGINDKFFTGNMALSIPGMEMHQWIEFVCLWNSTKSTSDKKYRKMRDQIVSKIKEASISDEQGENFKRLLFFSKNRCKKIEHDICNRFAEIEKMISDVGAQDVLGMLDDDRLRQHRDLVHKYLLRINAVCVLKEWE